MPLFSTLLLSLSLIVQNEALYEKKENVSRDSYYAISAAE